MASAFNLETHALITQDARNKSVLSISNLELAQRYGFDRLEPRHIFDNQNSFRCLANDPNSVSRRDAYIDARDAWLNAPGSNPRANVFGRCLTLFEQLSMPPAYTGLLPSPNPAVGATGWLRLEGWLMRGAIREDDFESGAYDNPNLIPDQDPWVDEFRSLNHFYDPIVDNTGIGPFRNIGQRSTTWALGIADEDNWTNVQLPEVARGNHFSDADARKLMFLALTYKRNFLVNYPEDAQLRMNMWATMFKSLGHIVHLLQDTASPQHVRGEGHSRLCNGSLYQDLPEQPEATRTFENFANYRVTEPFDRALDDAGVKKTYSFANLCDDEKWRDMFRTAGQARPTDTIAWTSGNTYPIPQFSVQRKFFTTRTEDAAINARRGLADYVNRGFFT